MKINQKGFAHLFLIIILVAGIALAVYLVQQRTNILPFAVEPTPCPISGPCPTPPPTKPPPPTPTPCPTLPCPTKPPPTPKPRILQTDFNGDGKSDLAVFRTTENKWYVKGLPATSWGRADQGDKPVPADYDGDGKADYAVFHASNQFNQSFYYIKYANGKEANINMGLFDGTGYVPVPADYNGDGKTDPAVWDPVVGSWKGPDVTNTWGRADQGDIPAPGDYDGDGKADFAVYHPSTKGGQSAFYIRYSNGKEAYPVFSNIVDGTGGIPVQADYNGDGKTDPAVVIPNYQLSVGQHRWFIQMDETKFPLSERMFDWGRGGSNIALTGDYNGDGKADATVWDSNDGMWYIRGVMNTPWGRGDKGDIPLPKSFTK